MRTRDKFSSGAVLFLALVTQANASGIPFQPRLEFGRLNVEHGLSHNSVNVIIQDRKGFLWFGTDGGLNRYDGYNFKIFRSDPRDSSGLSSDPIWSLCTDDDGSIWIGTDGGGVNRFYPETGEFIHYKHDPADSTSVSSNSISQVLKDSRGTIWVGTWEEGLNRFNRETNTFTRVVHNASDPGSLGSNRVWCIYEDKKGRLWIGTEGGGVDILDPLTNRFSHLRHDPKNKNSLSGNLIVWIMEDSRGHVWIANYSDGLNEFDPATGKFVHYRHNPSDSTTIAEDNIWRVFEDSRGQIWVGTVSHGLDMLDRQSNRFIHIRNKPDDPKSLSADYTHCMYEDSNHVLWVGTVDGGLNKLDRKPARFFRAKHEPGNSTSLTAGYIYTIYPDRYGDLWVGTLDGGLSRFKQSTRSFHTYRNNPKDPGSIASNTVRSLLEDRDGDLWVGTYHTGLDRFNRASETFVHYKRQEYDVSSLSDSHIRALFEDSFGDIWIGTSGTGLNRLNKASGKITRYPSVPEDRTTPSSNVITCIAEDKRGFVWAGTFGMGLNRFDRRTGRFKRYVPDPRNAGSLSSASVVAMKRDSKGRLWATSWGGGLMRYDDETDAFVVYTEQDGLASNHTQDIIEDNAHRLWIGTDRGITRFDPENGTFQNYGVADGVLARGVVPGTAAKDSKGWIYFGGADGLMGFHPDSVSANPWIPSVHITSFKVFNKEFETNRRIAEYDTIRLSYDQNFVTFGFSALDYTDPSRNQYKYILEGVDRDWVLSGGAPVAHYTSVQPGDYTFRVKGTNSSGVWNEAERRIVLLIAPPFWGTWWFRVISSVALVAGLVAFYRRRVRGLEKEKRAQQEFSLRLMESQETERKRIAGELHDSLGQDLLVIRNRALLGLKDAELSQHVHDQLDQISSVATQALDGVREISHDLRPYQLDRLGLTKAIVSITAGLADSSPVHFSMSADSIDNEVPDNQAIHVYRIVQEAINNILKHAAASEAQVTILLSANDIRMTISDNGRGMPSESEGSGSKRGFGLVGINERVKAMNGAMTLNSTPGKGTILTVVIPRVNRRGNTADPEK